MRIFSIFGGIAILAMASTNLFVINKVEEVNKSVRNLTEMTEANREEIKDISCNMPVNRDTIDFFTDSPNDTSVYKALLYFDIPNPKVVLAQAKLETGHYRKVPGGNLFGLRQRNGSYMRFGHWTESILSYKKYISSKYKGDENNTENYLEFLSNLGYAESPNYNRVLRIIVKNVENLDFVD
jgi:flagellar rod assembly protein/muramidase flgJ